MNSSSPSSSLGKHPRCTTSPSSSPPPPSKRHSFELVIPISSSSRSSSSPSSRDVTSASSERNSSPVLKENMEAVTAPQQDKLDKVAPLTPSKRTKAPEESLPTPATTPTKRVREDSTASASSAATLTPLVTPRRITNIFAHAHILLSTNSSISQLPLTGREKQRETLVSFLSARFPEVYAADDVEQQQSSAEPISAPRSSLYVSGPPGIGKTALLSSVLKEFSDMLAEQGREEDVKVHMENCSSLGSIGMASTVWERLGKGLGIDMTLGKGRAKLTGRQAFINGLKSGGKFLIILDEVDHVHSSSSAITSKDLLNNLFTLAREHSSSLTLIGIANSLDLTTRSLDLGAGFSLQAKGKGKATEEDQKPLHLHFPAYTSAEIQAIISQRLGHLGDAYPLDVTGVDAFSQESVQHEQLPLVAETALRLCATKVANQTGDVRAAFDIVRRAISTLEATELIKLSATLDTPTTPTKPHKKRFSTATDFDPLASLTTLTAPRVTLPIMSSCLRDAGFGVPAELASLLANLNLNSRMALVAICIALSRTSDAGFETRAKDRVVMTSVAYGVYCEVVRREGTLKPVNATEFAAVKDTLEAAAFIKPGSATSPKGKGRKVGGGASSSSSSSDPPILLSQYGLDALVQGLKVVPATECEGGMSTGALQETLRMSKSMLDAEEDRTFSVRRKMMYEKSGKGRDVMAPKAGFHGDGLEGAPASVVGKARKGGKAKGKGGKTWIGEGGKTVGEEEEGETVAEAAAAEGVETEVAEEDEEL